MSPSFLHFPSLTKLQTYTGTCRAPADCLDKYHGFIIDNRCSGGAYNKCCIQKHGCNGASSFCSHQSGYYGDFGKSVCDWYGGKWLSGKCPGPTAIKCCDYPSS
ncbi:hypothetical protein M011DRAFT_464345 [Sporormia fimetaria CBS 119925]|uniref:Uncharacterized protein n=1 Tax=Sporormia fimetaria CBS 119925 TaxID=1340428 RepID=A0A6A6VMX1_9PLEO|nr:hypothetical protein M011DRAFT_464345 [Sporormia fimetaria CBS 119925]